MLRSGWSAVNFDQRAQQTCPDLTNTHDPGSARHKRTFKSLMPLRDRWKSKNSVEVYRGVVPDCIFHLSFVLFSYCRSPFAPSLSRFVKRLLQPADSMPQRRRFRLRNRQTPILDTGSSSVASSRSGANIGNETVARRALLMTVAVCGTRLWTGSLEATCSRNSSTQLGSVPAASSHDPSRPWQAQISGVIAAHPRSHSGGFQVYVFLGSRVGDPAQAGKPATHPPATPPRTAPHHDDVQRRGGGKIRGRASPVDTGSPK